MNSGKLTVPWLFSQYDQNCETVADNYVAVRTWPPFCMNENKQINWRTYVMTLSDK